MGWLIKFIEENYKSKQIAKRRKYTRKLKFEQISNFIQIDKLFLNILPFTNLKLLKHYSKLV